MIARRSLSNAIPGEGLGLVVAITSNPASGAATLLERVGEPSLTSVDVFTMALPHRTSILAVDARSEASFLAGWSVLTGGTRRDTQPALVGASR